MENKLELLPQELVVLVLTQYFLAVTNSLDAPLSAENLLRPLQTCRLLRSVGWDIVRRNWDVILVKVYHTGKLAISRIPKHIH